MVGKAGDIYLRGVGTWSGPGPGKPGNVPSVPAFTGERPHCRGLIGTGRRLAGKSSETREEPLTVPEVKNFDDLALFMDPIINQNRCVDQLADVGASGNGASDVRKPSQQLHVIENCRCKSFGAGREVSPGVLDDLLEIR